MYLPLPMFVLRRLVRQNPWLLSDDGVVRRTRTLKFGVFELEVQAEAALRPEQKERLQAEADAGKL